MQLIQTAAPATEPITLTELKLHLRLDSGTLADNVSEVQNIAPGSHVVADNYTTHVGAAVEITGYSILVNLNSGANGAGGTVDCKIQESDDGVTFTDWTGGAFAQVTEANDNAIQEIAYTGIKAYIRTVANVLVADCVFGTTIVKVTQTTSEDDFLTTIITAAREQIEDITGRAIITQTWDYYPAEFPSEDRFKLPFGNLQSVTHIKYTDSDGDQTTMTDGTDYIVETNGEMCGQIVLPYGETWPSFTYYPSNPIVVRFICGWADAAAVPSRIKTAMKLIATDLYENREGHSFTSSAMDYKANPAVMSLLSPLRLWDEFV